MPPLRISVLIPSFNQARYVDETLACVFRQSCQPFEVVVVDDGSTDGTPALLEAYGDRIRFHREEHRGISATRNRCIDLAEGDTIAFLDADDLWPDESLELRAGVLLRSPDLDGVVGMVEHFVSPDLPEEKKESLHVPEGAAVARFAGSMLLRRRVFDRVGSFDTSLTVGDTMDWLARAEAAGVRIDPLQEVVLRRRIHGGNTVIREKGKQSDYLKILKANLDRRRAGQVGEPGEVERALNGEAEG